MSECSEPQSYVTVEFLARILCDRESGGGIRRLSEYLKDFPGHEEEIAREYLRFIQDEDGDDAPASEAEILGSYRIEREIGRGGQAIVHLARDERLGRLVALKILNKRAAAVDDLLVRFQREARVASRIDHPGICTVYEAGLEGQIAYIAMQYIEGRSLQALIESENIPRSRPAIERRLRILEDACRALHAAHEAGVIHRDLKPGNIMISVEEQPVLVDFGLARDLNRETPTLTAQGDVFGTPVFMSPEQIAGPDVDGRTDVYAMGVILYVAMTGRLPLQAPTLEAQLERLRGEPLPDPRAHNRVLDEELVTVYRTATEPELGRRYASAGVLADELRRLREREPVLARRPTLALRARRWLQRNPSAAVILLVLLLGSAGTSFFGLKAQGRLEEVLRLSDLRSLKQVLKEAREDLHPVGPELVPACEDWIARAEALLERREMHREWRGTRILGDRGVAAGPRLDTGPEAWLGGMNDELLRLLDELETERGIIRGRLERSRVLVDRSLRSEVAMWTRAIERIANSRRYRELDLEPQIGLVPLGEDPKSGLWEFWHLESGRRPRRDGRGHWRLEEESGVVLVLLPGGRFTMGDDPKRNPDWIQDEQAPPHVVSLDPFFISKYETTQAQWARANRGARPSYFQPGSDNGLSEAPGEMAVMSLLHPVERIHWFEARRVGWTLGLELPTEAQWEYACRGGTPALFDWWGGRSDPGCMQGRANVVGAESDRKHFFVGGKPDHRDEHRLHAPVGFYAANPFGLHDVSGNVNEWCRDRRVRSYASVSARPGDGLRDAPEEVESRIVRGGGMRQWIVSARSAQRSWQSARATLQDLGVRYVRSLTTLDEDLREEFEAWVSTSPVGERRR